MPYYELVVLREVLTKWFVLGERKANRFYLTSRSWSDVNASFSFTDKLFLFTYIQYNTQINNINLNTRLQWRFMPASDLFIVYTDNYLPDHFRAKNRSILFKIILNNKRC